MSDEKPEANPAGDKASEQPADAGRRDFINEVILGSLGIATVGALVVSYRYLSPNALFEPPMTFKAGNPDLYPINSVTYIQDQEVYIVRIAQGFYAISAICTHLGCITQWKPEADMIACPCHGSKYKMDGTLIHGPAPRPLPHFSIKLASDGELFVDKTETIKYGVALKV